MEQTLLVFRQIAVALDAAGRHGVIHRDLKPANIMVTSDNAVKVLDFRIAKVVETCTDAAETTASAQTNRTASGSILGTAGYMSPEQVRGQDIDPRSDAWAFGCCLFECLSGRAAFDGDTAQERMVATMERTPDWNVLSGVAAPIQTLVKSSLEKDREHRLAQLSDALGALDRVLLGDAGPKRGAAAPAPSPAAGTAAARRQKAPE